MVGNSLSNCCFLARQPGAGPEPGIVIPARVSTQAPRFSMSELPFLIRYVSMSWLILHDQKHRQGRQNPRKRVPIFDRETEPNDKMVPTYSVPKSRQHGSMRAC